MEHKFLEPEQDRLLRELEDIRTTHDRRSQIGKILADIGDTRKGVLVRPDGIPDIVWCSVEKGGQITIKIDKLSSNVVELCTFDIKPFYVAKYLTTYAQYEAFVADDGYKNPEWWKLFPHGHSGSPIPAINKTLNAPRDMLSWYESMAFANWLDAKYRQNGLFEAVLGLIPDDWKISLPPEWIWQWMAQNGDEKREYPWGAWDEYPRANTVIQSRILRKRDGVQIIWGRDSKSTSVGMYPHGIAACGAYDVSGNLWEWCLNDYDETISEMNSYFSDKEKTLRGGSFTFFPQEARAITRFVSDPSLISFNTGFRLFVIPTRL